MKALWSRRAVRHVVLGLLPLLVAGTAVTVLLAIRLAELAGPVRDATARATATVERVGLGPDARDLEVTWTDDAGARRTSYVRAARATSVPVGAEIVVRYRPGAPDRVFVSGDETSARISDLTSGIVLTTLITGGVLLASGVHVARRVAAERRPGTPVTVGPGRSRVGLTRRFWLLVRKDGRTWWMPVHWEPVLADLANGTPATAHGVPGRDRMLVVDVAGVPVWQAGRLRQTAPRGETDPDEETADAAGQRDVVPLRRHFRADAGLLATAPVLGLFWAYLDDGGVASWLMATAVAAGVLVWIPTVYGSDPT